MHFQRHSVLHVTLAAFAAGSVDVSYSGEYDAERGSPRSGSNGNRELKLLGTNPDVNVEYDGTLAQCAPGTVRRFDTAETDDPLCQDPDNSWELQYVLEVGEIKITSCPKDKVLKISGPDNKIPTEEDCAFLHNLASDIVTRPQYTNKLSLEAMTVKGAELICDWPAGLPMNHEVNFDTEWEYQRQITILFDSPGANVIMSKPREDIMYDEYYQSLCFVKNTLESKYVMDAQDQMAAKLSLDPPCAGDSDMNIGGPNMQDMTCKSVPQDASTSTVNWANGNCFGRCGGGCGAYPGAPAQFTNDCVDYDFCSRFQVDREGLIDNCYDEFLRTIDDTMWSGNCDPDTNMEEEAIECEGIPPTPAPIAQPNPPVSFNIKPVVITYIQGGDCNSACASASGDWECTTASLSEQNFRFTTGSIYREALSGLGVACADISPASGSSDPTAAKFNIPKNVCVSSADSRPTETFSCDAATDSSEVRFCTCYEEQ